MILNFKNATAVKPLNVITVDQTKSDHVNRMITITEEFYLVIFSKWEVKFDQISDIYITSDYFKRLSL